MKLRYYPDPILEKECDNIVNYLAIPKVVDNMFKIMYENKGVGLAAPQVGLSIALFVANIHKSRSKGLVFANPEMLKAEGSVCDIEGCLSFPDEFIFKTRPEYVMVKAYDKYGKEFVLEADGFLARVICHEYDHIKGILFTT